MDAVNYYTGEFIDISAITAAAHRHGIVAGFDLAHAAGNVPLALHDWGVDFAVWCHYKYLNGGPGCVAGCFVHDRHASRADLPRLAGWWGHDKQSRFQMGPDFVPIRGAEGWQLSNPPLFSLAALLPSLELFSEVGMARLRAKSERLTGLLDRALRELLPGPRRDHHATRPHTARVPAFGSREARREGRVQRAHRARCCVRLARAGRDPPRAGAAV